MSAGGTDDARWDAVVLAGGGASRLGGADKPGLQVGGLSLLEHVLAAVHDAAQVLVAGEPRAVRDGLPPVTWCPEHPPGGGPVAGIASAAASCRAPVVLVLAADLPWIAGAVPLLRAAVPPGGAAMLVDATGRRNHLAAAWDRVALVAALARLGDPAGAPVRALLTGVPVCEVPDASGWGRDCDTWDDVAAARREFGS